MPKKENNIYLRKDGRWEGRYPKDKTNGKTRYGYIFGKTFEEVESKINEITAYSSKLSTASGTSFESLSMEWLIAQKPQLKASSVAKYTNILTSYLIPRYGKMSVGSIARKEVVGHSRELLVAGGVKSNGLSPKTVNSILSVMKNIFAYAEREKCLHVADIKDISVKQPQKPMRILSRNEQQRLSSHLCENPTPCHLGILLCLYTGLRIGEICAMKWKDICINEQYLYVHQTMQRIQTHNSTKGKTEIVILPPKSDCSIRHIPIPSDIMQLLMPAQKQGDAFLLTGLIHSFIEPRCMENHFKAVAEECGIQNVNFHALRHTFATRCIELGFDIKSLSEILGHASVNITLNRYVHPSMELKQKNMDMLSELLTTK
jgi:integrase